MGNSSMDGFRRPFTAAAVPTTGASEGAGNGSPQVTAEQGVAWSWMKKARRDLVLSGQDRDIERYHVCDPDGTAFCKS